MFGPSAAKKNQSYIGKHATKQSTRSAKERRANACVDNGDSSMDVSGIESDVEVRHMQQNGSGVDASMGDRTLMTSTEVTKTHVRKNDILKMLGMVPDDSSDKAASENKSAESLSDNNSDDEDSDAEDANYLQEALL